MVPELPRTPPTYPSHNNEEPTSPTTCICLLTGGLLVRVQPEEPAFARRCRASARQASLRHAKAVSPVAPKSEGSRVSIIRRMSRRSSLRAEADGPCPSTAVDEASSVAAPFPEKHREDDAARLLPSSWVWTAVRSASSTSFEAMLTPRATTWGSRATCPRASSGTIMARVATRRRTVPGPWSCRWSSGPRGTPLDSRST